MSKYFVSRDDFDKIAIGSNASIQIYQKYSGHSQLVPCEMKEGKRTDVDLFECGGRTYKFQYRNKKVPQVDYRKPHQIVKRDWDDRVHRLKESIHEQEAVLDKYVNEDLKGIRSNLFVKLGFANVVETKLDELRKNLASLNLELDKTKDYYEKVGTDAQSRPV